MGQGNALVRMRAADSMNFAEGTVWSEGGAGTNAVGAALAAEHAVQMVVLDDRILFFANPEDAAEYISFDLQALS